MKLKPIVCLLFFVTTVYADDNAVTTYITEQQRRAQTETAAAHIMAIKNALMLYKLNTNQFPENLQVLTQPPAQILNTLPKDPWGNEYQYNKDDTIVIYSLGPDGIDGSGDEIRE